MALFILFVFWVVLCVLVGVFAASKGRSGVGFFFVSVLLSPLIGFVIVLVVHPIQANLEQRAMESGELQKCPYCAELIKSEASVCKHCGREVMAALTERKQNAAAQAAASQREARATALEQRRIRALDLCTELRGAPVDFGSYQVLASEAGGSLEMTSMMFDTYVYTHGESVTKIKKFKKLRPWFIDNVVPVIEKST